MPWYPPKDKSGRLTFSTQRDRALSAAKVGEWTEASRRIRALARVVPDSKRIIQDEAEKAKDKLKNDLYSGAYENEWPKLSDERQTEKDNNPQLGDHILIGFGDYVEAINTIPMGPNVWAFGIHRAATNREDKSLVMIGMSHEYGAGGNPPRPHWRPAYREFVDDVMDELELEMLKAVRGVE